MEYTAEQKEEIQRDYGARRQRQLIMTTPIGLVILALMFTNDWRCPGCSKYLGRSFNPRFCQRCGVQLHD